MAATKDGTQSRLDGLRQVCDAQFALAVVGILFFRLSAWSVYGNAFTESAGTAYALSRLAQLVATLSVVAYALLRTPGRRSLRAGALGAIVLMVFGSIASWAGDAGSMWFTVGRVLHGIGAAVLLIGWGAYTCRMDPRKSGMAIALAFALYALVTFFVPSLDVTTSGVLAIVCPVVSGGTLLATHHSLAHIVPDDPVPNKAALGKVPWANVWLFAACAIVCMVTSVCVADVVSSSSMYTGNVFRTVINVLAALVFAVSLCTSKSSSPDMFWPFFLFTVSVGLLGYSAFSIMSPEYSSLFLSGTQESLFLFSWIFTSGIVRRYELSPTISFALSTVIFMRTDLLSSVLQLAFPGSFPVPDTTVGIVLSFGMAVVLLGFTIFLLVRGTTEGPLLAPVDPEPLHPESQNGNYQWIQIYDLSPREQQVVELLLHGCTLAQAGERLGITLNTMRYYSKNVYRKLGIHSRAELVELADEASRER